MPYVVSLLPTPRTEKERLNPPQLVARLHTGNQYLGSLYVNVLGGSNTRGGIALDPLVSTGRLANDIKVEFAQLIRPRQVIRRPQSGVHLHFETLTQSKVRQTTETLTENGQNLSMHVLSAGSEEGFFVGQAGVVPWLCQVPGSKMWQQLTPHARGVRRVPVARKVAPQPVTNSSSTINETPKTKIQSSKPSLHTPKAETLWTS